MDEDPTNSVINKVGNAICQIIISKMIAPSIIPLMVLDASHTIPKVSPIINATTVHVDCGNITQRLNPNLMNSSINIALASGKNHIQVKFGVSYIYFDPNVQITYLNWDHLSMLLFLQVQLYLYHLQQCSTGSC